MDYDLAMIAAHFTGLESKVSKEAATLRVNVEKNGRGMDSPYGRKTLACEATAKRYRRWIDAILKARAATRKGASK